MRVQSLMIQNVRNFENAFFSPASGITVIAGQNGQGKTNLLECIWLLTGSKSFRGSKDTELVRLGCAYGRLSAKIEKNQTIKKIDLLLQTGEEGQRGRTAKINDVDFGRASSMAGVFTAVVFEPDHLGLIKGSPEQRRRFLDGAICQLYPGYLKTLRRYMRVISQKNALLKSPKGAIHTDKLLEAFDQEQAAQGEEILRKRREYLLRLIPVCEERYIDISCGRESMEVLHKPCCNEGQLFSLLGEKRQQDIRAGFCTVGPHRDDFETRIDGKETKSFGSQGQQRSAVISLKLAEAQVADNIAGEHPVMLLDDVLSELDEMRQTYLLEYMEGKQTIVTTCEPAVFSRTAQYIVQVKNGQIVSN